MTVASLSFLQALFIFPKLSLLASMGALAGVVLLFAALVMSLSLLRSLRVVTWVGASVYGTLVAAFFLGGAGAKSSWWFFVILGIFLLVWALFTPLFLRWERFFLSLGVWVVSFLFLLDLTLFVSAFIARVNASSKPSSLVEFLLFLGLVVLLLVSRLPRYFWFRLLVWGYVAATFAFYGYGAIVPEFLQASLLDRLFFLFSLVAGVFALGNIGHLWQRGGRKDFLAHYESFSGVMLTHVFLIFFTAATIYPILWVVKMAVTPRQGFSMGLSPIPNSLSNYWRAWRRGDERVAACYRRAMAQNFREIMGMGGACVDRVCAAYRQSKDRSILSYERICKPFIAAWKRPVKLRDSAVAAWRKRMLGAESNQAKRLKLQKLMKGIVYEQAERDRQGALFWRQLLNSIIVAFSTTLLGVFLAGTAGYAFSRFNFPGRQVGLMSFLISQMFPGTLMMIPLYILVSRLGLLNQLMGLTLVYSTISIPFCVWMLKGYFDTIPKELEEAALIDGASRTLIFWKIMLPLARPAIAVTALFSFMTAWNEFILAATFMNEETSYTLPVMLQRFVGAHNTEWGHFAAGAILVSLPIIFLFFLLQKHLVGGLTAGSVKG